MSTVTWIYLTDTDDIFHWCLITSRVLDILLDTVYSGVSIPKIKMLFNSYCLKTRLRLLINHQRHSSLNPFSIQLKLCNIFIFGMAYCIPYIYRTEMLANASNRVTPDFHSHILLVGDEMFVHEKYSDITYCFKTL